MYIVYACKRNDLDKILSSGYISSSSNLKESKSWLDEFPENRVEHSDSIFMSLIFDGKANPSKDFSYLIFNPSVIRESLYWSPTWHALEHMRYYYNKDISYKKNLENWKQVFLPYLDDYKKDYTYNIYNIIQNEIVFRNKVSLKYLAYIIE